MPFLKRVFQPKVLHMTPKRIITYIFTHITKGCKVFTYNYVICNVWRLVRIYIYLPSWTFLRCHGFSVYTCAKLPSIKHSAVADSCRQRVSGLWGTQGVWVVQMDFPKHWITDASKSKYQIAVFVRLLLLSKRARKRYARCIAWLTCGHAPFENGPASGDIVHTLRSWVQHRCELHLLLKRMSLIFLWTAWRVCRGLGKNLSGKNMWENSRSLCCHSDHEGFGYAKYCDLFWSEATERQVWWWWRKWTKVQVPNGTVLGDLASPSSA